MTRAITPYARELYRHRMVHHLQSAKWWLRRFTYAPDAARTQSVIHLRLALRFANRCASHDHKAFIMRALNALRGVAPQSAFTCHLGG